MTNKCEICKNKEICKYKEDYEKKFKEIEKLNDNKIFPITLECIYFKDGSYSWTWYNGDGKYYSGETHVKNKCEGCPTYERIKKGEMFVSDECSFCQNSPTKVTCYSSNSTMDYCGCGNTIGDIHSVGSCEGSCSCGNKKGGCKK